MNRQVSYVINGKPIPWTRPKSNGKHFFDSYSHEKLSWALNLEREHGDRFPFTKPIEIVITFFFTGRNEIQNKNEEYRPNRPNLDSLIKFVVDAAQDAGILKDDAIIVSLHARKTFSLMPRTEFTIREI